MPTALSASASRQTSKPPAPRADVPPAALQQAIEQSRNASLDWWERVNGADGSPRSLLAVPDVGPTCELLLADQVFHDLSDDERDCLLDWVRSQQAPSGAWLGASGGPDLSLTALGFWVRAQYGDPVDDESMVGALRVVHELGGAQRASLTVRLWLAMAAIVPWSWLPAVPSELWLLPEYVPLSPTRISAWARGMVTPYHLLSQAPARLHLEDSHALLLCTQAGEPIPPRLTSPGLAGDLLQAFDRSIKIARKLPRGAVHERSLSRARGFIDRTQQEHGGWFSARPTLYSLLALRVASATSDDPRIRRGLDYLRAARGCPGPVSQTGHLAQGLVSRPLGINARLALAAGRLDVSQLLVEELSSPGPWQLRADAPVGGWPHEAGAQNHLDLEATCEVLEVLRQENGRRRVGQATWASMRRAGEVLMAMQEPDGGFARFERGESSVPLSRFPWRDADQLKWGDEGDEPRVARTASVVRQLSHLGWRAEDDRIGRGLDYLETQFRLRGRIWSLSTLAEVARAAARQCKPDHALRVDSERRLRERQREDGSFGTRVDTARGLTALLEFAKAGAGSSGGKVRGNSGTPCVQATRAARDLTNRTLEPHKSDPVATRPGFGLSPIQLDPSAADRETHLALLAHQQAGGTL